MTTGQSPKTKELPEDPWEPDTSPPEVQFVPVMRETWQATMAELAELRAVLTRHAAVLDELYVMLGRSGREP